MNNQGIVNDATLCSNIVSIQRALNGFIVNVGCKTVVFENQTKMIAELDRYLKDEQAVSKEYLDRAAVKL